MKMLYFTFNLGVADYSGLPTYSESFLEYFGRLHEILVVNIIADQREPDRIEEYGDRWNCYCKNIFSSYYADLGALVEKIVEDRQPDFVILQDYIMEQYVARFYGRQNFTKVFFVHLCQRGLTDSYMRQPFFDSYMQQSMVSLSQKAWEEWKSVSTSDIIITNSEFTTAEIRKHYCEEIRGKDIVTAPLGIDVDSVPFQPCFDSNKWAYFGRLEAQKGINYIIRDFVDNPDLYRENPLVIIGDGSMDNAIIKADFFDGFVKFHGLKPKSELRDILADVKFCIFPSIYEPWGLALTEALAMGKICVVSSTGGGMLEQVLYFDETQKIAVRSSDEVGADRSYLNGFVLDFRRNSAAKFVADLNSRMTREVFDTMAENSRESARRESLHFEILKPIFEETHNG